MSNVYNGSVNYHGQVFTQKTSSLLSKCLMVAGIGFVVIFAMAFALFQLMLKFENQILGKQEIIAGLMIGSVILLIVSMIMSVVLWMRIEKCSPITIFFAMAFYSIAEGISFGIFFFALKLETTYNTLDFLFIFLIVGLIFSITGLIGNLLSNKAFVSFTKFIIIATFSFLAMYLIFFIVSFFAFNSKYFNYMSYIIYGISGILTILYLVWDFAAIRKLDSFVSLKEDAIQRKYVLMFGFKLLIDLIALVWHVIRLYMLIKR